MAKQGNDIGGTYQYNDIIDYSQCCTCQHFSDNWHEERFECLCEIECNNYECYEE